MKKNFFLVFIILAIMAILLPACDFKADGSIKSITHPYVAEYECVEGRLGETNLLEKYEFIKITLLNDKEFEVNFKTKNGKRYSFGGNYEIDGETREMTGEVGILGYKYREKVTVENGEFLIFKNILSKPLVIKFKMK